VIFFSDPWQVHFPVSCSFFPALYFPARLSPPFFSGFLYVFPALNPPTPPSFSERDERRLHETLVNIGFVVCSLALFLSLHLFSICCHRILPVAATLNLTLFRVAKTSWPSHFFKSRFLPPQPSPNTVRSSPFRFSIIRSKSGKNSP